MTLQNTSEMGEMTSPHVISSRKGSQNAKAGAIDVESAGLKGQQVSSMAMAKGYVDRGMQLAKQRPALVGIVGFVVILWLILIVWLIVSFLATPEIRVKQIHKPQEKAHTTVQKTDHGETVTTEQEDGSIVQRSTEVTDEGVRTRIVIRLPDPDAGAGLRGKRSPMQDLGGIQQMMLRGIADRLNDAQGFAGNLDDADAIDHHDGTQGLGEALINGLHDARNPFGEMDGMMMASPFDQIMGGGPGGMMTPGFHVVHLGVPQRGGGMEDGINGLLNALMPQVSLEDMIRSAIIKDIMEDIQAKYKDVPDKYKDPVTHAILDEPAYIYWPGDQIWKEMGFEMHQIKHWFEIGRTTNPANDEPMTKFDVVPAPELKAEIQKWKAEHADMIHDGKDKDGNDKVKRVLVLTTTDNEQSRDELEKQFKAQGFNQVDVKNFENANDFVDSTEFSGEGYHAIYDLGILPKAYRDETLMATFWGKIEKMFADKTSEFIASNKLDPEAIKFGHEKVCTEQQLTCHKLKIQSLKQFDGGVHWTRWRREAEL